MINNDATNLMTIFSTWNNSSNNINPWCVSNVTLDNTANLNINPWCVSKVKPMKTDNLYKNIYLIEYFYFKHYISFSYDKLIAAFFHNVISYIEQFRDHCIPFELFKDISENTHLFNVFYLVNNQYIIKEYKKLSIEEKEILNQDKTMHDFFNEIDAILNLENF